MRITLRDCFPPHWRTTTRPPAAPQPLPLPPTSSIVFELYVDTPQGPQLRPFRWCQRGRACPTCASITRPDYVAYLDMHGVRHDFQVPGFVGGRYNPPIFPALLPRDLHTCGGGGGDEDDKNDDVSANDGGNDGANGSVNDSGSWEEANDPQVGQDGQEDEDEDELDWSFLTDDGDDGGDGGDGGDDHQQPFLVTLRDLVAASVPDDGGHPSDDRFGAVGDRRPGASAGSRR